MNKTNAMSEAVSNLQRMLGEERQGFVPGELVSLRGAVVMELLAEVALANTPSESSAILAYVVDVSGSRLAELSETLTPFGLQMMINNVNGVQEITPAKIENIAAALHQSPTFILIDGVSENDVSLKDWCRDLKEYAVQKGIVCFICHDDDVEISNEMDLELRFTATSTDEGSLVSVERGKHRKSTLTPADDLRFEFVIE